LLAHVAHVLLSGTQVSYKVPFTAHYRKPVAVATAFFGVFMLALGARRVDLSLQKKLK
jgi:oligosaccharyltransferase complex subunit alpha (ribophorin I)